MNIQTGFPRVRERDIIITRCAERINYKLTLRLSQPVLMELKYKFMYVIEEERKGKKKQTGKGRQIIYYQLIIGVNITKNMKLRLKKKGLSENRTERVIEWVNYPLIRSDNNSTSYNLPLPSIT